jgi:hypothetical protein
MTLTAAAEARTTAVTGENGDYSGQKICGVVLLVASSTTTTSTAA